MSCCVVKCFHDAHCHQPSQRQTRLQRFFIANNYFLVCDTPDVLSVTSGLRGIAAPFNYFLHQNTAGMKPETSNRV